ncbi:H-NS histone family protein [Loktanella sp. Alg231-35]|uniref:H-NS histone family protein n=1 Tax=Loktanella sp. Alg231-35 TaxID=1922220 RepID=UPI000D55E894|nr:H-NS histone family protein [Loktanella sp. Alg231-35]
MKYDLKSLNRKELEKLTANVEKALARVEKKEMKEALAAAEKAAKAHGFALSEITGDTTPPTKAKRKSAAKPKKPGVAKYANPDDKTQTWTGKGRRPDWFLAAMAAGKTPEDLEV